MADQRICEFDGCLDLATHYIAYIVDDRSGQGHFCVLHATAEITGSAGTSWINGGLCRPDPTPRLPEIEIDDALGL